MNRSRQWVFALATMVLIASPLRAGMFEDLVKTLRFAGFTADSTYVGTSNSSIAVIANNFQGNTIDLGDFEFSLNGPASFVFETGGRQIRELEFTLSSGLFNINPNQVPTVGPAQPIVYSFSFDSGTNSTQIVGNFLFDIRGKINQFGSYDLSLQASNRQTTFLDGRFEDFATGNADFDLGPLDLEGNIVADFLATVTDPFFEAAGLENIFAEFSGRVFREQQAFDIVSALQAKVDAGGKLNEDELTRLSAVAFFANLLGDDVPDTSFVSADALDITPGTIPSSVPEPTTALLLSLGATVMLRRRRR